MPHHRTDIVPKRRGHARGLPDPAFWDGRRVFLTGHTGFKGSWLTLWLQQLGARVTGYALAPPTQPSLFDQANVGTAAESIIADIRDAERLAAAIRRCRPEIVLHLAAQSVVRTGYSDPVLTYGSNVMGTVYVLEAIRRLDQPCVVVNVTSDKCYAPRADGPGYREDEPMGGHDPYSNSKGCAELVTTAYRASFFPPADIDSHGVALASARAGNAIGGGDWTPHQLIPDLMRAFRAGRPCLIRNPGSIRPWQFVLEPLRGYLMLAERLAEDGPRFSTGWNFGPLPQDAKPVSWIADYLARSWGDSASWKRDREPHPAETPVLRLDATKARNELLWHPVVGLETALDWILEWYRSEAAGDDPARTTRDQIRRYADLLTCTDPGG